METQDSHHKVEIIFKEVDREEVVVTTEAAGDKHHLAEEEVAAEDKGSKLLAVGRIK